MNGLQSFFESAEWQVLKYRGDSVDEKDLYEVIEGHGNLLTYGGASAFWNRLVNATPTVGVFNLANTYLGVGDGVTGAANTQTTLQGSNTLLKQATAVNHTDATTAGAQQATLITTFATGDANFAWQEWGVFNAASAGRMLNRKVESLGTKTSAATWQLTLTLSLA